MKKYSSPALAFGALLGVAFVLPPVPVASYVPETQESCNAGESQACYQEIGLNCPTQEWYSAQGWEGNTDSELEQEEASKMARAGFSEDCPLAYWE